jgi:hypothetical protein
MQTPNMTSVPKYSGSVAYLLASFNCLELSQITRDNLRVFLDREGASPLQASKLYALWSGGEQVSVELRTLLEEISYPRERDRLLSYLRDPIVPTPAVENLLEMLAWK